MRFLPNIMILNKGFHIMVSKTINEMLTVKKGVINGEVTLISSGPLKLGVTYSSKSGSIPFQVPLPSNAKIKELTLEIAVTHSSEPHNVKWRVWFNGFPLTREFKPQITVEAKDKFFSKVLFDVTPVLQAKGFREELILAIKYDGNENLIVDHANLIVTYEASEAKSSYIYCSGAILVPPQTSVKYPFEISELIEGFGELRGVMIVSSKLSETKIFLNGKNIYNAANITGAEEFYIENIDLKPKNILEIQHETSNIQVRDYVNLSTILATITYMLKPKLDIINAKLESQGEKEKVIATIKNNGASKPDKAWLLVIDTGVVVSRQRLPELTPGEEIQIEIPCKKQMLTKHGLMFIRVVWTKLSRTFTSEMRLR